MYYSIHTINPFIQQTVSKHGPNKISSFSNNVCFDSTVSCNVSRDFQVKIFKILNNTFFVYLGIKQKLIYCIHDTVPLINYY